MNVWFCLLLLPFVCFSLRITSEENAKIKRTCGATYLGAFDRLKLLTQGHPVRGKLRIEGGRTLWRNQYPWIAALHRNEHVCTGSLISNRHILTAAHCVIRTEVKGVLPAEVCRRNGHLNKRHIFEGNWTIFVGSSCTNPEKCDEGWLKPDQIYFHEDFNECSVVNDIAIFEFKNDIPRSMASPICMPDENHSVFHTLKVVGSGRTGDGAPTKGYKTIDVDFIGTEGNLIVAEASPEQGICPGDSGGPLFQTDSLNRNVLIGLESYGGSCTASLKPNELRIDFATDVRKYLDWICEKTGVCPMEEDIKKAAFQNT